MELTEKLIKPALESIWGIGVNAAVSTLSDRLHNRYAQRRCE